MAARFGDRQVDGAALVERAGAQPEPVGAPWSRESSTTSSGMLVFASVRCTPLDGRRPQPPARLVAH